MGPNTTSYVDSSLQSNSTYYYRAYATSETGVSLYTNQIGGSTSACSATGAILREYWANVPGHNIKDIPLNSPPTSTSRLTSFRTAAGYGDNYGQRIRGYICAPTTDSYTFFVQGDDAAELYLSTDNSPANKRLIASARVAWDWTGKASQQSAPISLVGGKSYYVEVLHKESSGGDQVRVGWRTPGSPILPVPGSVLSPFVTATDNGLLACYSFSGNTLDGSSYGKKATVNGAKLTTDRFGRANSAYDFNGTSDYIDIPADNLILHHYTYSLWAKPSAVLGTYGLSALLSIGSSTYIDRDQNLLYDSQEGWSLLSYDGARHNPSACSAGSLPAIDTWVHLVITRDYTSINLYVDGVLACKSPVEYPLAYYGSYDLVKAHIGTRANVEGQGEYQYFQGALDDVQIYSQAMSATQVMALHQQIGSACQTNLAARLVEEKEEAPPSLLKAIPNPTTGATTVEFTAAETGWLGVQLYNLQGQLLQQLFGQEVEAGTTHQQPLDATSLSSGMYLLRMVNGQRVEHHKLLVTH